VEFEPDVSVVVPVWGDYVGPALTEALDSLRAQDLPARIMVVDNACDPPLEPMDAIDVVRSDHRLTVGAARNLGLESVTTPYVVFWDADDVMLPGTLGVLRRVLAADPDAVLVAAAIYEGDPPVPHRWPRRWSSKLARWPRLFALADAMWSLFPTTGSSMIRAAAARQSGFADANSGEDWVLGVSLALRGRILFTDHPGRLYRRHTVGLWEGQRSPAQLAKNARAVRERLRADPETPRWLRLFTPLIATFQLLASHLVQPLLRTMRATRPIRRSAP
jgi:glycosyltransferase involved in cell wall biosynthesis